MKPCIVLATSHGPAMQKWRRCAEWRWSIHLRFRTFHPHWYGARQPDGDFFHGNKWLLPIWSQVRMNFRSVFLEPNLLEFVSTGSDRISTVLLHDFTSRIPQPRGPGIPCVWWWIMSLGWDMVLGSQSECTWITEYPHLYDVKLPPECSRFDVVALQRGCWWVEDRTTTRGEGQTLTTTQLLSKVARWVPANMWNGYTTTAWLPRVQGLRLHVVEQRSAM